MKKICLLISAILSLALLGGCTHLAGKGIEDHYGKHYDLDIIGMKRCVQGDSSAGDCFNGDASEIQASGNTFFIPLVTDWIKESSSFAGNNTYSSESEVYQLQRWCRILVSDAYGDDIKIIDNDASDGTVKFNLPHGSYAVYAFTSGKTDGRMDSDRFACYDEIEDEMVKVKCRPDPYKGQYVLIGHVYVEPSAGDPAWRITNMVLLYETGVNRNVPGYFDYFWQIRGNGLRWLQLRFYPE